MKVTILTPTYNDSISIEKTLDSLRKQTFEEWESIIIDDGSTDNTKEILENYINKYKLSGKIKYIYQSNSDQLNAIINGLNYSTGEYIFTLHSDDLLPADDFLEKAVEYMDSHLEYDAITGDLIIIDEQDKVTNIWKALDYKNNKQDIASLILNGGANIYGDVYFLRKNIYETIVKNNYLEWNTPIWINFMEDSVEMLNIKTVDFPMLKYRIHSNNYAKNEIGKFNLLNGELRTLTKILHFFDIKNYFFSYIIFNVFRAPGFRKLKMYKYQNIKYSSKETKHRKIYKIVKKTIMHSFGKEYKNNIFLNSLLEFYNKLDTDRALTISSEFEKIYKGKDVREFAVKIYNNQLETEYVNLLNEMKLGFNKIVVKNEQEIKNIIDICKFLCIYPYVQILCEEKRNEEIYK